MQRILFIIIFLVSLVCCKSDEQKRKEYLESDAYKNTLKAEAELEADLAKLRKDSFELALQPLQNQLHALENELHIKEVGGMANQYLLKIKRQIADTRTLIVNKETEFEVNEILLRYKMDSLNK